MNKTILIAESSEKVSQNIGNVLRAKGFNVIESSGGKEAVSRVLAGDVDVVVYDLAIKLMDGITFCEIIRTGENFSWVPIIILATESGDEKKGMAREAGITKWITKPFNPELICNEIVKTLEEEELSHVPDKNFTKAADFFKHL